MVCVGEDAASVARVEELDEGEEPGAPRKRLGQPDLAHLPIATEVAAEVHLPGAWGKSTHEQPAAVKPHHRREIGSMIMLPQKRFVLLKYGAQVRKIRDHLPYSDQIAMFGTHNN